MRNRTRTIASLRRLAERPGTPAEGDVARRMLERMGNYQWAALPFEHSKFPRGTRVFYCYWCYENDEGVIACDKPKIERGETWMRIKFDRLKQPRWVPVTSEFGCHIGMVPFVGNEASVLYHRTLEDRQSWPSF